MTDPIILHTLIYILIGAFAGLMAGLFGIGGGLVVVPGLLFVFQKTQFAPSNILMYFAVGTSLAAMIITSMASVLAHYKISPIFWSVFHKLWPSLILGTVFGSITAAWIPTQWLTVFFAFFLFYVALKIIFDTNKKHSEHFPKNWVNYLVNFLIGTNSGLLGVGGGVLIVPYLTYCGIDVRKIAAISNLCALTIALVGTGAFMISGNRITALIPNTTGYIYWPAVALIGIPSSLLASVGARLNYKLPVRQLRYGFVMLLILTAVHMLFKGL